MAFKVTMAEIAEYAKVERPAVSNWRRRYEDFPGPIEEDGRQPLFDSEEIATWLDGRWLPKGELEPDGPDTYGDRFREALRFHAVTALRGTMSGDDLVARGIALAAASAVLREDLDQQPYEQIRRARPDLGPLFRRDLEELGADSSPLERIVTGMLYEMRPGDVAERLIRQADRVEATFRAKMTPKAIGDLIARISASYSWQTVYDPAAGVGSLLLKVVATRTGDQLRIIAGDIDRWSLQTLRLRLLSHGLDVDSLCGDSFKATREIKADLVVVDPPFVPSEGSGPLPDPFDWVRLAHKHLAAGGMGCVVVPAWSLLRTGLAERNAQIRSELAQAGLIRAVIRLPPRSNSFRVGAELAVVVLDQAQGSNRTIMLAESGRLGRDWIDQVAALVRERPAEVPEGVNLVRARDCDDRLSLLPSGNGPLTVEIAADALLDAQRLLAHLFPDDSQLFRHALMSLRGRPRSATLGEYARSGRLKVLPGHRIATTYIREGGIPVLGVEECRGSRPIGERGVDVFDLGGAEAVQLTEPGDVIVLNVHPVRAFVDAEGGKIAMAPAQVLRIARGTGRETGRGGAAPTEPDWMTPGLLAALLSNPRNHARVTGGLVKRLSLKGLELPELDPDEVALLDQVFRTIEERRAELRRKLAALEGFEAALVAGVADGALRPTELRTHDE